MRGPRGGAAGAVWGPGGRGVAGVRGPYGGGFVTNLPGGAIHYPWHGHDYWHAGYGWWRPCWLGDGLSYAWAYPPIGYYYPSLPDDYETVVIENNTYYESDGVYYQEAPADVQPNDEGTVSAPEEGRAAGNEPIAQEGPVVEHGATGAPTTPDAGTGYIVVEVPEGAVDSTESGDNPFKHLKAMCDYLSGLQSFTAVAQTTSDRIGPNGDKIQVSARRSLVVDRPDKVAVDVKDDYGEKRIVYDGKSVSMLDRRINYYTVVEVPGTIEAALDTLAKDYDIVVPLEDLMYKDLFDRMHNRVTAAQYLGLHSVNGVPCHHLAFSTDRSGLEIWIDAADKPIPRKLAIDYRQNASRSRYSADIVTWNDAPSVTPDTFEFKLPEDVTRFEMPPKNAEG